MQISLYCGQGSGSGSAGKRKKSDPDSAPASDPTLIRYEKNNTFIF